MLRDTNTIPKDHSLTLVVDGNETQKKLFQGELRRNSDILQSFLVMS